MPFDIKLTRENLDGLPETVAITELYEQQDDGSYKFAPNIEGVKPITDFDRVQEALRKERSDHQKVKTKFKPLDGREVDDIIAQLDEIEDLRARIEAGGNPDDGKINELVEKRLAAMKAPLDRQIADLEGKLSEALSNLETTTREYHGMSIAQALDSLIDQHCNPDVKLDVKDIGRMSLVVDEDGQIVSRGESPLPVDEWLQDMLKQRPHWNKTSGGGGGGRGQEKRGDGKGKNPFSPDNVNWSGRRPQWNPGALAAQDAYLKEHGRAAYEAAARAVGADPARPGSLPNRPST